MRRWLLLLLAVPLIPAASAEPVDVHVAVYVVNLGDHNVNQGTYTIDFYLVLRYDAGAAPADFSPDRFEFMNGRARSRELLSDTTLDGQREVWYRIQAGLYSEPRFRNFPYDKQSLEILLEDAVHPAEQLRYVVVEARSGIDPEVRVSGWRIDDWKLGVDEQEYPFGENYSRVEFRITVSREPLSITIRTFLPPLTFVTLAGLAFFLAPAKVDNRFSLATGMLVSAVAFHISQTVSLPSLGRLSLFDQAMISAYVFIGGSLSVAVLISRVRSRHPEADVAHLNRRGAMATGLGAALVFVLLRLV